MKGNGFSIALVVMMAVVAIGILSECSTTKNNVEQTRMELERKKEIFQQEREDFQRRLLNEEHQRQVEMFQQNMENMF